MKPVLHAAAILMLSIIAAAMTWWIKGPMEANCDPTTLESGQICLQLIPEEKEVLWIDARSREEWKRNGIPGSILWNLDVNEDMQDFEAKAVEAIFNRPFVVIYCSDRECGTSKAVADQIRNLDLGAEVHVLHGGWQALKTAGWVE